MVVSQSAPAQCMDVTVYDVLLHGVAESCCASDGHNSIALVVYIAVYSSCSHISVYCSSCTHSSKYCSSGLHGSQCCSFQGSHLSTGAWISKERKVVYLYRGQNGLLIVSWACCAA